MACDGGKHYQCLHEQVALVLAHVPGSGINHESIMTKIATQFCTVDKPPQVFGFFGMS